jgi:hypothetical protein
VAPDRGRSAPTRQPGPAEPQVALPNDLATLPAEAVAPHAMPTVPGEQAPPMITPPQPLNEQAPSLITPPHRASEQAPGLITPPRQPIERPTPMQDKPAPARRGISRRTAIIAGCSAVAVVAAGGLTWAFIPRSPTTTSAQTPGATTTTAKTTPTSNTGLGAGVLATDNFHRPNQTFWGKASDGQYTWGQGASTSQDFSIFNNTGQIQRAANGNSLYTATLGPTITDADLVVTGTLSSFMNSHIGAMLRWTDDTHYYKAYIDGTNLNLLRRGTPGKGGTFQSTPFPAQQNTSYTLRFRVVGATLEAKAWQTASTEPANWMVTATETTFQTGLAGLRPQVSQNVTLQITGFTLKTATNP